MSLLTKRPDPVLKSNQQWCDHCDGCGWHEGGEAIVTVCKDCEGTGIFPTPRREDRNEQS